MTEAQSAAEKASFSEKDLKKVLWQLAQYGAQAPHPQYELAEQVAMALQSISSTIAPDGSYHRADINAIYGTLKDPKAFAADDFTAACGALEKSLRG